MWKSLIKNFSNLEREKYHHFWKIRPRFTMCPIASQFCNEKTRDMDNLPHDFTKIVIFAIFCNFLNFWQSVTILSEIGIQKYFNTIFPKVFPIDSENFSKIPIACQEVIFYSNPPWNYWPAAEKKLTAWRQARAKDSKKVEMFAVSPNNFPKISKNRHRLKLMDRL